MKLAGELLRRPALRDWSVAVAIIVIGLVDLAANVHSENWPGAPWPHALFLIASAVPLGFRRFAPALAPVLTIAIETIWNISLYPRDNQASFEAFLEMLAAAYILGSDLRGRRQLVVSTVVGVVILPTWLVAFGAGQSPGNVIPAVVFTILAWAVGYTLRRRKEQAAVERARADRLAFEQGRLAAEAVIEERSRIARELHDVVAHSLSLMVVQASAERRAVGAGNADLSSTEQVLESVETTGRAALVELRRLLGLLRRTDEPASRDPQPSLRHVEGLVEQVRATGATVEVQISGDVAGLPPGVDLTAYRIVQEALTNVVKHSGARHVAVTVRRGHTLELEIVDDGTGADGNLPPGGHGLIGMRERVAVYGGVIDVGPRKPGPGFHVKVRLPIGTPVGVGVAGDAAVCRSAAGGAVDV